VREEIGAGAERGAGQADPRRSEQRTEERQPLPAYKKYVFYVRNQFKINFNTSAIT